MDNLDQVDNQQCNIYEPYLTSLPCLYGNHALLKTAHLTYLALSIPYSMTLFRGASLSRRAVFTNSLTYLLTHSLTNSQTKVQIKMQDRYPTSTFTMTSRPYIKLHPYPNHPKQYLNYLALNIPYPMTLS